MQSRIDQMLSAWNQLDLLKSVRSPHGKNYSTAGLEKIEPPSFKAMPTIPLIGLAPSGSSANGITSTPPRLTSAHAPKISSSTIELPELPEQIVEADTAGSQTPSPAASPRTNETEISRHSLNVKKLRRKVSNQFKKLTTDLSEIAQKMSPRSERNSPDKSSPLIISSPVIKSSSVLKSSPRKEDPCLSSLPSAERSRIAVAMAELCLSDDYKNASSARQSLLFNGKLVGFLESHPDMIRADTFKALRADLEWRMCNACIDIVVDLDDARFAASIKKEIDGRFIRTWGNEKAGEEGESNYPKVKGKMTKTFLRDFPNTSSFLKFSDGRLEKIDHPEQLMQFVGPGDDGDLPYLVSHVANQNLTTFLNAVLFRRESANGEFDSVIKLWDGSPVTPKGNMRATYTYSKDSAGNIVLEHDYFCSKMTSPYNLGTSPANDSFNKKPAHDHAEVKVTVRVKFAPNGDWEIENPHVRAKGWNVPAED